MTSLGTPLQTNLEVGERLGQLVEMERRQSRSSVEVLSKQVRSLDGTTDFIIQSPGVEGFACGVWF